MIWTELFFYKLYLLDPNEITIISELSIVINYYISVTSLILDSVNAICNNTNIKYASFVNVKTIIWIVHLQTCRRLI